MAEATRTRGEIEAELEAARDLLANNIANLVNQVHPRAIAHRAVADVRGAASAQVNALKAQLVEPDGRLNVPRAALVGAAVAGAVAFVAVVRSLLRR
ncbi:MAG: DUF3618 domain-containing protein [Actinobacteria bacterium]|nr:DUF3618 domain-containing protein [Actinomycetota bacterium]